jgi:hypothetical protein
MVKDVLTGEFESSGAVAVQVTVVVPIGNTDPRGRGAVRGRRGGTVGAGHRRERPAEGSPEVLVAFAVMSAGVARVRSSSGSVCLTHSGELPGRVESPGV